CVVISKQVYWASSFILPKAVNAEIEQLMRSFLWSHDALRLEIFWDVPVFNDSFWGWRKILQCRDVLRMHFVHRIGDGSQTSVWFDNWLSLGRLSLFISKRDIYEARLSLGCKVCDIVERGDFSASNVWANLAEVKPMVSWHKLVWFSQNIPRHAFMVWLAINHRPINISIWSILQRLDIGSMVYFIWLEKNLPRFQDKRRTVKDLCGFIRDNVRLRLMSLKIKKFVQVMEAARLWDFGVEECNGGKSFFVV
nr:zf-RVT domain-containing protein [Tanacetum cinerariifolium]